MAVFIKDIDKREGVIQELWGSVYAATITKHGFAYHEEAVTAANLAIVHFKGTFKRDYRYHE